MPVQFKFCPVCADPLGEKVDPDGQVRKACSSCDFVHYENPTPVVAAIVQRGDDVVLVRSIGWPETWFGLVTGFLEREEHPEIAVVREVKEELGVDDVQLGDLIGLYSFERMNQLIIAYHVVIQEDAEITLDANELEAYKLVPVSRLKPWPFGTGEAVKHWLASRD